MSHPVQSPGHNGAKLNKAQKLAALLVILGPDSAVQILKTLDERDLETIVAEMSRLTMITQEMQDDILSEFADVAVMAGSSIRGGVDYAHQVLERAVGNYKASSVITRVAPVRAASPGMQQLVELEPRQVFNMVRNEQPQTIALVLSYLAPEKASAVLSMLRTDVREHVVERLATLGATPVEIVGKLVKVLTEKIAGDAPRVLHHSGGVKSAANLLNALDKEVTKSLLVSLDERNPQLSQAIRQKMFTFEDVAKLDMPALQRILREVDMRDLALALKTAADGTRQAILACMSKRAAETVQEEIGFLGAVKRRDIEAAQLRVIEVVRRLESEGEVDLSAALQKEDHAEVA